MGLMVREDRPRSPQVTRQCLLEVTSRSLEGLWQFGHSGPWRAVGRAEAAT
jgi:hypothetical protein